MTNMMPLIFVAQFDAFWGVSTTTSTSCSSPASSGETAPYLFRSWLSNKASFSEDMVSFQYEFLIFTWKRFGPFGRTPNEGVCWKFVVCFEVDRRAGTRFGQSRRSNCGHARSYFKTQSVKITKVFCHSDFTWNQSRRTKSFHFYTFWGSEILIFIDFCTFWRVKFTKLTKFTAPKIAQKVHFSLQKSAKIHKNWIKIFRICWNDRFWYSRFSNFDFT